MKDSIDMLISFDTTGSMFPCLTQVRRYVKTTVDQLFDWVPNLRVAIIAMGDYCDGDKCITQMDFSSDKLKIMDFITKAPATHGGDAPECYELSLNKGRSLSWQSEKSKAFIIIGDDVPHEKTDSQNKDKLDWRNEAGLLKEMGVKVFAVQALSRNHATSFYEELASLTGGIHLELNQFEHINSLIQGVCLKQKDKGNFITKFVGDNYYTRSLSDILDGKTSVKKKRKVVNLDAVNPGRFQALTVDEDTAIKQFVLDNGLSFKKGRGFYEFTKPVDIQSYKEVIIQDKNTGDMFSGDKAREILGIPVGKNARVRPTDLTKYRGFVQSTSVNRKLLGGTKFLYEVEDYEH